jgi:hypothetical protein
VIVREPCTKAANSGRTLGKAAQRSQASRAKTACGKPATTGVVASLVLTSHKEAAESWHLPIVIRQLVREAVKTPKAAVYGAPESHLSESPHRPPTLRQLTDVFARPHLLHGHSPEISGSTSFSSRCSLSRKLCPILCVTSRVHSTPCPSVKLDVAFALAQNNFAP